MTDEGIALEDRESKLLPLGADVQAPALVAISNALRTTAVRERPMPLNGEGRRSGLVSARYPDQ